MEDAEKAKVLDLLIQGAYSIRLNVSDTFAFATADSEDMDTYDLEIMLPVILKYGHSAFTAYVAVKRAQEPIDCKCNHKQPAYQEAKKEIEALREEHEYFMSE
jgi:hypothetical protein